MGTIAFYAFLAMTPTTAFLALAKGCEWVARYEPRISVSFSSVRSIEQLTRDLRRLGDQQRGVREGEVPAKAARLRSLMLAYDDTLLATCLAVGLPRPSQPPLPDAVRLEIELALTQQGVVW